MPDFCCGFQSVVGSCVFVRRERALWSDGESHWLHPETRAGPPPEDHGCGLASLSRQRCFPVQLWSSSIQETHTHRGYVHTNSVLDVRHCWVTWETRNFKTLYVSLSSFSLIFSTHFSHLSFSSVGRPIPVVQNSCPSKEDIDNLHSLYMEVSEEVF